MLESEPELELDSEEIGYSFDDRNQSGIKGSVTIPSSNKAHIVSRKNKNLFVTKQNEGKGVGSNMITSKGSDDLRIPIAVGGITSENFFKQTSESSPL